MPMIVPNYVPDPLEVPGNVTLEKYRIRLKFIRSVCWWFSGSVAFVAIIAALAPHQSRLDLLFYAWLGQILLSDIIRVSIRGSRFEAQFSAICLPGILIVEGLILGVLHHQGYPTGAALAGLVCIPLYTAVAGRDFSFLGCFFLCLIPSSIIISAYALVMGHPGMDVARALGWNLVVLSYVVYDQSQILFRRRTNEVVGAVVDLHRDMLNIFGYIPRVIRHWNKHHIWLDFPLELHFKPSEFLKSSAKKAE